MNNVKITAEQITGIEHCPKSKQLDLIRVGPYLVLDTAGKHKVGDIVAVFPHGILIPNSLAKQLDIAEYLREAVYPGDTEPTKCRVTSLMFRGVLSDGFIYKTKWAYEVGLDMTARFQGVSYEG